MRKRIKKLNIKLLVLIVNISLLFLIQIPTHPIVSVLPSGVDSDGNLLAIETGQQDDSSGVGDVIPFFRSSFDFTGIAIRYEKSQGSYTWGIPNDLLKFNSIWIQWISFELPTTEMSFRVRLYELEESESDNVTVVVEKNVWEFSKSSIMAKGYLYFQLPKSKTERILEIQRFIAVNENITIYDDTIFFMKHKTVSTLIPVTFMPVDFIMANFTSIVIATVSTGFGSFWHGKRIIKRSTYPPEMWSGWIWIVGMTIGLIITNQTFLLPIMLEFPLLLVVVYILIMVFVYMLSQKLTIRMFKTKPDRIALMQPSSDLDTVKANLKMVAGYVYYYKDKKGNKKEGWIPEGSLNDANEHKRRMKGKHREVIVSLLKVVEDGSVKIVNEWGLIFDDPAKTYREIRVAVSIKQPCNKRVRRVVRTKQVVVNGEKKQIPQKNSLGQLIYDETVIQEAQENLIVEAAPEGYKSYFETLLSLKTVLELSTKYHSNLEKLVKENIKLQKKSKIDHWGDVGTETMKAFLTFMNARTQIDFQSDMATLSAELAKAGIKQKGDLGKDGKPILTNLSNDQIEKLKKELGIKSENKEEDESNV